MIDRRTFVALVAGTLATPRTARTQPNMSKAVFYASVGPVLWVYDVDLDGAALSRQGSVTLPANIQYVWRHPSAHFLYVASSNGSAGSGGIKGDKHDLSALRIDPRGGALAPHGSPATLRSRPIHMSLDRAGAYALVAYNNPSSVSVHRINPDGTVGDEVRQAGALDTGIYAHQILVTPSNNAAILVTRGNDAAGGKPEDPGALKIFSFRDGQLANRGSVASDGGYGFGPRHLDFHPTQPFVYVSLERQNKLNAYRLTADDLDPQALFAKDTLAEPGATRSRQAASAVHVHPNGRTVYVGNRASDPVDFQGQKVFPGGENNIAVFALDPATGAPTLIQNADVRGIHPRTFSLDPGGRLLVAANLMPVLVRDGAGVKTQPANLAVFRVGTDGKLDFARSYEVDTGGVLQFWTGMVGLS